MLFCATDSVDEGTRFLVNLKNALEMRDVQKGNFEKYSETFGDEIRSEWEAMIEAWNNNCTQPNLYKEKEISKYFGW